MRLERLNPDKFKVFLTFDDMKERGLTKEDLWQDLPKVHDLFRDMMNEADDVLGFKIDGPIAVEVYAMPAQGMVIIVSKSKHEDLLFDEEESEDGFIEMQVTLDETDEIFYEFDDIEDVIGLSARLYSIGIIGGSLYSYMNRYYLNFIEDEIDIMDEDSCVALLSEYGTPSTVSSHLVEEYGKVVVLDGAINLLYTHFLKGR